MREGLRSGKLRFRPERDRVLSEKKVKEEDVANGVNLDGAKTLFLGANDKEVVVPSEQGCKDVCAERAEVLKVKFGETAPTELIETENGESEQKNQSIKEDFCYQKATSGSMAKRVKADDLASVVPFSGRVLRSMTISGVEPEKREQEDDEIISIEVKKKRGRPPKTEKAEVDDNKKDAIISAEFKKKTEPPPKIREGEMDENQKEEVMSTEVQKKRGQPPRIKKDEDDDNEKDGLVLVEVKKKRGRPPKIKKLEVDENEEDEIISTGVKKKWGRPPKIRKAEIDENKEEKQLSTDQVPWKLRKKRGRPYKLETLMIEVENSSLLGENRLKKRGRPRKKCGRPPKEGTPAGMLSKSPLMVANIRGSLRSRVLRVKKSWKKLVGRALRKGNQGKKDNLRRHENNKKEYDSRLENGEGNEESNFPEGGRREEKQKVRDKIMKLIIGAGWTVQYRPREGKSYQDAVYVSPDGKTYWSITLAYKVLKHHYEEGDGESTVYTKGFVFNPITNEELRILARITKQKREGLGREDSDATMKKKLKGKRISEKTSLGGPVCAKVSGKNSLHGESPLLPSCNRRRQESENNRRRGLFVRKAGENELGEDNYVLYKGKRTVLAWMINMGVVADNGVVLYRQRKSSQADLNGWVTKDGIHCFCCDEVITTAEFEAHAGHKGWNMALQNILLDNGKSLLQCELTTWNKQEELAKKGFYDIDTNCDDPNDDTCGICGDGGNLVCCESCPSTFHLCCLGMKKFPSGDWHCPYCSCKYCGMVVVGTCERSNDGATAISVLNKCLLCEDKFHRSCVVAGDTIEDAWASRSFCGKKCLKLNKDIEGLLGVEHKLEEGYSCTLVRRSDIDFGITTFDELSQKVHSNSKVAVALSIMGECFRPVDDRRSGINLIQNILYNCGSNFNRLNFSGFYTAILEKGDEMISVASIRIHGNLLAEMPFIGTRYVYRRQGMCRRLLTALESILGNIKVEKLIIPAIDELKETWTSVFGFDPIRGELRKRMRNMNIVAFPGVDMLQKQLSGPPALVENITSAEGPFLTQDKDVNKDGSDITNDNVQFSDSENGKNQIIQVDEPSGVEEKCGDMMNPLPVDHESPQDLSACLNLETPGADMELEEKSSVDVKIVADGESLVISISNGGSENLACNQKIESAISSEFSGNAIDGEEGLVLGNGSLSPIEAFHDAEEEILAGIEYPSPQEGDPPSSKCETEEPLHQPGASCEPCNQAPPAAPYDHPNEINPLLYIMVGSGQVFRVHSNPEASAEEGAEGCLSEEFIGYDVDGKRGMAPVIGQPCPDELFYDAKEETVAIPERPPNADEKKPPYDELESGNARQPAANSSGACNEAPSVIPDLPSLGVAPVETNGKTLF